MSTITPGLIGGAERGSHGLAGDRPERFHHDHINVGPAERAVSTAIGGAMLLTGLGYALGRRSGPAVAGGTLMAAIGGSFLWRGVTGHCSMYETVGVESRGGTFSNPLTRSIHAEWAVQINRPVELVYNAWRELENLPRVMPHVHRVKNLGEGRSRWTVQGPRGDVEWVARITEDRPNELIAWETEEGADVDHQGVVRFRPATGGRGTIVHARFDYHPTGGVIGAAIAKLYGQGPQQQIRQDLKRFKAYCECGEAPTTEGQPRGTCS